MKKLEMRGFMICLHQMNDFLPWCGQNRTAVEMTIRGMKKAGLNTLLMEYETFFPWSGREKQICASNAFTEEEITAINRCAGDNGVEIIPLVQVLGHVYHILIHEDYRKCAESPEAPQQLCPLAEESFELAKWFEPEKIVYDDGSFANKVKMFHYAADVKSASSGDV